MSKATTILKVGDRVRISKGSQFYSTAGSESNPSDVTGTIEKVNECKTPEFCYSVKWDNGEKNSYMEGDLYLYRGDNKSDRKKQDKLTVTKEFVLEAYKSACSDWKMKLEQEFPELFETDKYPTLIDLNKGDQVYSAELYVRIEGADGKTRYQPLNGVQIADGIADGRTLPVNAKYKALYFTDKAVGYGKYEIKHKVSDKDRGDGGSHVVYFEKKK
jgi:hypothetical protein